MREKGFAPIIFILGILIISGLIVGGSFYFKNNMVLNKKLIVSPTPVAENTESGQDAIDKVPTDQLLSCSNDRENIECPDGYTCYHAVPGGLAPPNIPPERTSGDKKCHKDCIFDKDCPIITPICVKKTIQVSDVTGPNKNICFSQVEGQKIREEQYQKCLSRKGVKYDEVAKGNQSIIVTLSSKYPSEILTKEFGLFILEEKKIKDFGDEELLYTVTTSDNSKENLLITACRLDLDARIKHVVVVYKGELF